MKGPQAGGDMRRLHGRAVPLAVGRGTEMGRKLRWGIRHRTRTTRQERGMAGGSRTVLLAQITVLGS